ncbi:MULTISPECIES: DMT family transporter [unclassified Moraxella]|uniref:DMT family transporter n=1 Tax=unclassified Moraxella TaxID=2685852 RepID=UPI003AF7E502
MTTTGNTLSKHSHEQRTAVILGLLSVLAFSLTLPFNKIAIHALTGIEIGVVRSIIAGSVAVLILLITKSKLPNSRQIFQLYLASIGLIYGFPILSAQAMKSVPVSHGAVVLAILPLATAVWGILFSRKNMSKSFWAWSLVGASLVLCYVLFRHGLGSMAQFAVGDFYLGVAVILAGFGYAMSGKLSSEMKGWQVMCWLLTINLPILLVLAYWLVEWQKLLIMTPTQTLAMGYLSMVSGLFGFFMWNKALAMGGIAKISQLQLLQTFFTYGIAILFMGEILDWVSLAVGVLVVFCVWQIQQSAKK